MAGNQINLNFPDSTYSAANKPSVVTLQGDLTAIETAVNAIDTQMLEKDGSVAMTGDLPMGGNKITGAGAGSAATDGATIGGAETLTNKTLTSPVLNTQVTGTAVLDEDDMASDSATQIATQQSIKKYVDDNTRGTTRYKMVMASEMWESATSGSSAITNQEFAANGIDYRYLAFDPTSAEYAQTMITLPPDWNAGTITVQFFWYTTGASSSASVVWGAQARAIGNGDLINQAFGTAQEVTDTSASTNTMYISPETAAITVDNAGAGEPIQVRVYRDPTDGSDNLTQDAKLLGIKITYTIN